MISVGKARKKIYACSTDTYTGFQATMKEEESKKFNSLPEVLFVLPDSYIYEEYGGTLSCFYLIPFIPF